jgi:hypothetical protein
MRQQFINKERYILNVQMLLEYCYMENGHRKLTTGILANENIIQAQSKIKTGDCKARNETEMIRNETGRNERKRNETEQKRNKIKQKRNES